MPGKTISILIRIVIWLTLLLLLFFGGLKFNIPQVSFIKSGLNVVLLILLAYVNSKILIPRLFTSKRIVFYIFSAFALIVLYVLISKVIIFSNHSDFIITIQEIGTNVKMTSNAWIFLRLLSIVLSTGVLFASTAFALIKKFHQQEQQKMEMEIKNKTAELKLINTQFSPHFFLNSLNNLYSVSKLKPQNTSLYIEKMTALMQYITYEQMGKKVLLEKEVDFIKNYIYFQQEKGDKLFNVTTDFNKADQSILIEPRLFIPFVENAFKFAYQPNKTMNITIRIETNNDTLYFSVINNISTHERRDKEDGYFGVGINSVKELLVNLYPDRHKLNIIKSDNQYSVELTLNLRNE